MTVVDFLRSLFAPVAPAETYRQREWREAGERWTEHNAKAKAQGCQCGEPATHVERYHETHGPVPYEHWTCEEHVGVNMWAGATPGWTRLERCAGCDISVHCMGSGGKIDGPTTRWYCPVKPEHPVRRLM